MKQDTYAHWRDSARTPQFLLMDARAVVVLLFIAIFPSWTKTFVGLGVLVVFAILGFFKIPLTVAGRRLLGVLAGRDKLRH
jgi:hypothetical protein